MLTYVKWFHVYVYVYECVYVCMHMCIYVYVYIRMRECVCMYLYINTCMHLSIRALAFLPLSVLILHVNTGQEIPDSQSSQGSSQAEHEAGQKRPRPRWYATTTKQSATRHTTCEACVCMYLYINTCMHLSIRALAFLPLSVLILHVNTGQEIPDSQSSQGSSQAEHEAGQKRPRPRWYATTTKQSATRHTTCEAQIY